MPSTQTIRLGPLTKHWHHQLSRLQDNSALQRFWGRDLSLWPRYAIRRDAGKDLLGWLDVADHLEATAVPIARLGESLVGRGYTDIVFVAISSSSLAADLIHSLQLRTHGARFHVLSQMEPSGLRALERDLDFKHTVFLIASKSGKNLEMHSLLLYLLARVRAAGVSIPAENFIAITEDGSYLAALAKEDRFRAVLSEPHGFRGRFSGVIHYGQLLIGLCESDAAKIISNVREMRECCKLESMIEQNPAASLAALLAAIVEGGYSRFIQRTPPNLGPFAHRMGHLVGSSSCKEEKGITPFLEIEVSDPAILQTACTLCEIRFKTDPVLPAHDKEIPAVSVELDSIESIPAEIFKWEVAVCLACHLLGVNPFEDPDFGDGRESAINFIEEFSRHQKMAVSPRMTEGNLSLYVEGKLRHDISSLSVEQALASFFALRGPEGSAVVLNYAWNVPEVRARIAELARQMSAQLLVPTQLATGPWYLHILGQCYKGGPRGGVALMITCDSTERIEVPGASYTFGDLVLALALGDMNAMTSRGRPIIRIHLSGDPSSALAELEAAIGKALKIVRRR